MKQKTTKSFSQEEMNRIQSVFEASPIGMYECDSTGTITIANKAYATITEIPLNKLIGAKIWDFQAPGKLKEELPAYLEYLVKEKPEPTPYTTQNILKDGTIVDIEIFWNYIFDDNNNVTGFSCALSDITQRALLKKNLEKAKSDYDELVSNVEIGLMVFDSEATLLFSNEAAKELVDVTAKSIDGTAITDDLWTFFREDGSKIAVEDYPVSRTLATGKPVHSFVLGYKQPITKKTVWVTVSTSITPENDNRSRRVICTFYDSTLQQTAKSLIEESNAKWRSFTESSPDFIMVLDLDGRIQFINKTVPDLTLEQVLGQPAQCFVPDDYKPILTDCYKKVGESKSIHEYETAYQSAEGETSYFHTTVGPLIKDGKVVSLISCAREITAQKEGTIEKEALLRQLKVKNEDLESFNYTVSHDLKSPLVTIEGFLSLVVDELDDNAKTRAAPFVDRITSAVSLMNSLISDLLELSRAGNDLGQVESEVDISEVITHILKLTSLDNRLQPSQIVIQKNLPKVKTNRQGIAQVFQNLLENAYKYCENHDSLLIEIGTIPSEETTFFVRDNGIGIDKKYFSNIFGLFQQLDPKIEGSGVGLALVKKIIEICGGKIWVESEGVGKGATFFFTFSDK